MKKNRVNSLKTIVNQAGYGTGDTLVVAVSGGPDSLALLHQLWQIIARDKLHVAHLDHGIRPSSAADARFVAKLSQEWGLPYHCKRIAVPELARRQKWSLEEAARNARYKFLALVANDAGAEVVAVGHNADDQAETILLHLLRGSGLTGLRGMQQVSPFPGASGLKLVRPLLGQSRDEIEAYCDQHELRPISDETNSDPAYLRNRIRLELLPQLTDYNPQIVEQLNQLGAIITAEEDLAVGFLNNLWPDLVADEGRGWLSLDRLRFQDLPLALQRRAVRRAVETLNPEISDLSFKSVEQAVDVARRKESGIETMLPGGLTMLADYEALLFSVPGNERPCHLPQLFGDEPIALAVPGKVELANRWIVKAQPVQGRMGDPNPRNDPWLAVVNLPQEASLHVRARRSGERMQPLGMDGRSASLQDIMVNRKLSARLRDKWPLVATEDHIIWLAGHIVDHRARISDDSRHVVRLKFERIGGDQ